MRKAIVIVLPIVLVVFLSWFMVFKSWIWFNGWIAKHSGIEWLIGNADRDADNYYIGHVIGPVSVEGDRKYLRLWLGNINNKAIGSEFIIFRDTRYIVKVVSVSGELVFNTIKCEIIERSWGTLGLKVESMDNAASRLWLCVLSLVAVWPMGQYKP